MGPLTFNPCNIPQDKPVPLDVKEMVKCVLPVENVNSNELERLYLEEYWILNSYYTSLPSGVAHVARYKILKGSGFVNFMTSVEATGAQKGQYRCNATQYGLCISLFIKL